MKKLINDPRHVVRELLEGLVDSNPRLALLAEEAVVVRADLPETPEERAVAVIAGGGSGHEPAHAGFVGMGMLTAAIAGDVFTSPSVDAVYAAIRASAGPNGALLVVKNYTGDRLNFTLAAEMARANGIPTEIVMIADDVALRESLPRDRSRGLAGTVLIHKIAGAAAARGESLKAVTALAEAAAASLGTMGIALGSCIVPTAGKAGFELSEREIEFGLGIHGEKGARKAELMPAAAIVVQMLDAILEEIGSADDGLGVLINGLGGTPPMELAIVAREALAGLRSRGLRVDMIWTGEFMTALEMPGCSISLIPLNDERRELLNAPTEVRVWPRSADVPATRRVVALPVAGTAVDAPVGGDGAEDPVLRRALDAIAERLIASEETLTHLDAQAGDGDLGASMTRGAQALRQLPGGVLHSPRQCLLAVGDALRRAIAGSSGPFYATALLRAAQVLPTHDATPEDWMNAFSAARFAVSEIGGAVPGDRTMVDALAPAQEAFVAAIQQGAAGLAALDEAVRAAEEGARSTAQLQPKFGRAAYLGERALGTPDGGAVAVAIWLAALRDSLDASGD